MYPRGAGSQRDIEAIVHQHRNRQRRDQLTRPRQQLAWLDVLQTQLHTGHPATRRGETHAHEVTTIE